MKGDADDKHSKQLADKYRQSWRRASEEGRQALCSRLGIAYTHVDDEALLTAVAQAQQAEYETGRETLKTERDALIRTALDAAAPKGKRRRHSEIAY